MKCGLWGWKTLSSSPWNSLFLPKQYTKNNTASWKTCREWCHNQRPKRCKGRYYIHILGQTPIWPEQKKYISWRIKVGFQKLLPIASVFQMWFLYRSKLIPLIVLGILPLILSMLSFLCFFINLRAELCYCPTSVMI